MSVSSPRGEGRLRGEGRIASHLLVGADEAAEGGRVVKGEGRLREGGCIASHLLVGADEAAERGRMVQVQGTGRRTFQTPDRSQIGDPTALGKLGRLPRSSERSTYVQLMLNLR
eukprot:1181391-Prorocentrum_minimum.AAC.3